MTVLPWKNWRTQTLGAEMGCVKLTSRTIREDKACIRTLQCYRKPEHILCRVERMNVENTCASTSMLRIRHVDAMIAKPIIAVYIKRHSIVYH